MIYKTSHWISALISNSDVYSRFYNQKHKVVLDLGCRTPKDVFQLYHHFPNFLNLYAVDNNSHFDSDGKSKMDNILEGFKTMYDYYQSFHFTNPITEDNFREVFNINLSITAEEFLENTNTKFDLIILSNFLHMYNDHSLAVNICQLAIKQLKKNGLIYISVANKNHEYNKNVMRTTYTKDAILELMYGLEEVIFLRKKTHYQCLFSK